MIKKKYVYVYQLYIQKADDSSKLKNVTKMVPRNQDRTGYSNE